MIIVGAKGLAKQIVQVAEQRKVKHIAFFDNVNLNDNELYGYPILHSFEEAKHYFENVSNEFVVGIGGPKFRIKFYQEFLELGGKPTNLISDFAQIANHGVEIGNGTAILTSTLIENDVSIGKGSLVNTFAAIHHDCVIGDFCEISPGAIVLGEVQIGNNTMIGAGAIILPKIKIGDNVVVGAGSIVTKNVSNNNVVKGNPAK